MLKEILEEVKDKNSESLYYLEEEVLALLEKAIKASNDKSLTRKLKDIVMNIELIIDNEYNK